MTSRIPERERSLPAPGSHNVFFALWPSDAVRAGIADAAQTLQTESAGRRVASSRYHLTLHFLGNHARIEPAFVARAVEAGTAIDGVPFELVLDVAGSFRNRSVPWWLGCTDMPPALQGLWSRLGAALDAAGIPTFGSAPFVPHVTIRRDARAAAEPRRIAPIVWPVDEFVLVDSVLGAGSSYTVVQRWRLPSR